MGGEPLKIPSPSNTSPQNVLFAPTRFINDEMLLTKTGELAVIIPLRGVDPEWQTDDMLSAGHGALVSAFRSLPENVRIYQYLVKSSGVRVPTQDDYQSPVVTQTVKDRVHFLENSQFRLSSISLYMALVFEPTSGMSGLTEIKNSITSAVAPKTSLVIAQEKIDEMERSFSGFLRGFIQQTRELLGLRIYSKKEAFQFLRFLGCMNQELAAVEPLKYDNHLDVWMGSTSYDQNPGGLSIGGNDIIVASLRGLPQVTWPASMAELLQIDGDFLLCAQYKRRPRSKVTSLIARAQDHLNHAKYIRNLRTLFSLAISRGDKSAIVPDEGAVQDIAELSRVTTLLNHSDHLGHFGMTGIFFDQDKLRRESCFTEAMRVIGTSEGSLMRETYWAQGAYASIIPGKIPKYNFRQRVNWLPITQFVDLGLLYSHDAGQQVNRHLKREYLIPLRTHSNTLSYLNLHVNGVMGGLIIGATGSGKSVTANCLIDHAMKYSPETLILDGLGGSYRTLTMKHGGNYFELNPEDGWPFTLNPFSLSDTKRNRQYLSLLIRACLAAGKLKTNAKRNQVVYEAVAKVYSLPADQRCFSAVELPGDMGIYFKPWQRGGQNDFVFDNMKDTFSLSKMQTIDFSAMDDYPDILQPLLFHFFYLWGQIVDDPARLGTLKQMWVDEGWKMISYPAARAYIKTAGRTWRKRNGGVMLITQSIDELKQASIMSILNELCPVKIILHNPGADFEEYAKLFKLNERELDHFRSLHGKHDLLVKTPTGSKRLYLDLEDAALWTYCNSPFENQLRDEYIGKYGFAEGIRRLAAEQERIVA